MIRKVFDNKDLKRFLDLPFGIYAQDPNWVRPMLGIEGATFNPRINPALQGLDYELFLCQKDNRIAGRIGLFLCHEFNKIHNTKAVFFGLFECENDVDVARELFNAAEEFGARHHMGSVIGPIDLTPNYTMGILVEGFGKPSIMTPYNPSYYGKLIEDCSYQKVMDLYAYEHFRERGIPARMQRLASLVERRYPSLVIKTLRGGNFGQTVAALKEVYNAAFTNNWGYLPMTDGEMANSVRYVMQQGDVDLVYIAYIGNEPIGILISLPDPNRKGVIRLSVMGVKQEYRGKGVETRLALRFLEDSFLRKGYKVLEYSVILENNEPMNNYIHKESGCPVTKVFRVYEKQLV